MSRFDRHRLALAALLLALCPAAPALAFVDANQASAADLEAIKGIGPGMRQRIIEARRQQAFSHWPDFIRRVPGVGPARAGQLSAQGLTIHGLPYRPDHPPASAAGAARGIGAPGPMPSGVPWHRVEPQPLLPLPR